MRNALSGMRLYTRYLSHLAHTCVERGGQQHTERRVPVAHRAKSPSSHGREGLQDSGATDRHRAGPPAFLRAARAAIHPQAAVADHHTCGSQVSSDRAQ
eukprot:1189348-Prorocentrum_minimum.AAC.6